MSHASRRLAGVLLIVYPTVIFGGVSLLQMIISSDPGYVENETRQDLWRAGHAHAGIMLLLSLVLLRYIDEASLGEGTRELVRHAAPAAAICSPSRSSSRSSIRSPPSRTTSSTSRTSRRRSSRRRC